MKLLLLLLCLSIPFAKKYPDSKAPRKPRQMSAELYCSACQAMVREGSARLRHRTLESDVVEMMESFRDMWNFKMYEYPPPEMIKGITALLAEYEEEYEQAMVHRFDKDDVEHYFCHEVTKACIGVDLSFPPPSPDDGNAMVNGEEVPMDFTNPNNAEL
jgi:hypothetical protein